MSLKKASEGSEAFLFGSGADGGSGFKVSYEKNKSSRCRGHGIGP